MSITKGLIKEFFVNYLLNRFQLEIYNKVSMFKPTNLVQSVSLALLQKETMDSMLQKVCNQM